MPPLPLLRRILALGLAGGAVATAVGFVLLGAICGLSQLDETQPSEANAPATRPTPYCVSYIHPLAPVLVALAVAGLLSVAMGKRQMAWAIGFLLIMAGFPLIFSMGFFPWVVGALLVAAGFVARPPGPSAAP